MAQNNRNKSRRVTLSKDKEQQLIKEITVYEIRINDTLELHVSINEQVGKKAAAYIEALVSSRDIPKPSTINAQYKGVVQLATAMYDQQKNIDKLPAWMASALGPKKRSPREFLGDSIDRWQKHAETYLNVAQVEGFLAAIVADGALIIKSFDEDGTEIARESIPGGFFTRRIEGGYQIYETHPNIPIAEIPTNYFDNTELNAERLINGFPPVPNKDIRIGQEQMLALIDAVKRESADFSYGLETFFSNYTDSVIGKALDAADEVAEYDDAGFQPEPMDGNPPASDGTADTP